MKCPHCGANVPDGDLYCGECGKSVQAPPLAQAPSSGPTVYGPSPVSAQVPPQPPPQMPPQPAKKASAIPWLIIALVIAGLCVICGGGGAAVYFLRPTATPTWTPTATWTPTMPATATFTPAPTATFTPVPPATPTQAPTPSIVTVVFSDPYAGLSVNYPADWVIADQSVGDSAVVAESQEVYDDPALGAWFLLVVDQGSAGLADLESMFVDEFTSEDIQLGAREAVVIGGSQGVAYSLKGTVPDASREIQAHTLLVMNGDVGLLMMFGSPSDAWDRNWPILQTMIDSVSLSAPVVIDLPTVAPTPAAVPEVLWFVCAPGIDADGYPVGETDVFPVGTTELYCSFEYQGFAGVSEYDAVFYRFEGEDTSGTLSTTGDDSGVTWVRRYNETGLWPGDYTAEIYVAGNWLASTQFTVLGAAVLQDDFTEASSGWNTWDADTSTVDYVDGELRILVKNENWTAYSTYGSLPADAFGDFAIEVDGWLTEYPDQGGELGIVARRDGQNYYQCVVSYSGFAKIRKHAEEGWTTLVDWVESSAINTGVDAINHLRLECQGSTIRCYANGVYLGEAEDSSFTSGQLGLVGGSYEAGPGVGVTFDDVVVYKFP